MVDFNFSGTLDRVEFLRLMRLPKVGAAASYLSLCRACLFGGACSFVATEGEELEGLHQGLRLQELGQRS